MEINKDKYPYCYSGHQYALAVVSGKIDVCLYVVGPCKRYLADLEKAKDKDNSYYYDINKAERYLRLVQKFKHVKGKWKNPCIIYEPWQNFIFMNIFGFILHETGNRRYRTAHVEIPRGCGKSAMASQLGLYMLALENPVGNEVYSAATGRDQARIILDSARAMAKKAKAFLAATKTTVLAHKIVHDSSDSYFKALSADSSTLDGLQPVCGLIDELHSHKDRGVYDVIDSAMSKRNDSLLFMITTAGFDTTGIGYSQSQYAKRVAIGDVDDSSFFAIVYTMDLRNEEHGILEDDDMFDPAIWAKANPNYGISVDPINFASKANKAKLNHNDLNNFMVKHLNLWTNAKNPFFNIIKWDECKKDIKFKDFKNRKCWIGLDLASKVDLASIAYVFKVDDKYQIFTENFCPEETISESKNENYPNWVKDAWLTQTPGAAINYPKLQEEVIKSKKEFKILGVNYDPWNATEFSQRLASQNIDMVEFRMTTGNLSEPMKQLDALIREGRIEHNGNPLLRWCMGNVVAKIDVNENYFPRKDAEELKIDPVIAVIMALAGWINEEESESCYERHGLRFL